MEGILGRSSALALALTLAALGAVMLLVPQRAALAHHLCSATGSPFGPFDFETYEAADYRTTYSDTLELAGFNQLLPDIPSFALPLLETGDRAAGSSQTVDPYIPPVILKSIAWLESGWAQGSYDPLVQYGEVGDTLISHDCGYGLMQVTTGMQNASGVPNLDQAMIGGHYAFNVARGARILADKWNQATEFRPIVGIRDPHIIEDWYFALWGYNGFAFENHPLSPDNPWPRAPYSCQGGADRSPYPYQELVLGCIMNPPVRGGVPLWPAQEVHVPDWSDPAFAGPLSPDNWAACSSGNCAAMDIPTPNARHTDPTTLTVDRSAVLGAPAASASRLQILFTPTLAGAISSTNVQISNPGSGLLAFRVVSTAQWVKVSRTQGVALGEDLGTRGVTLSLSAESAGLTPGFYAALVRVESLYGAGAPITIAVNMAYYPNTAYPDGSLLKGSDPAVYLLTGGVRRHVPDLPTFLANGYAWDIRSVDDGVLSTYPVGKPLPSVLADGVLIAGSGPEVWVANGGVRRHVPSPAVFEACGFGWDTIRFLSDEAVSSIPDGGPLTGACPRFSPGEGSLVRAVGGTHVYQMKQGLKRHVPNPFTLEALGLTFAEIDVFADSTIAAIPTGAQLLDASADGYLYTGSGPEVYVTETGVLRHITSPEALVACGYAWSALQHVPDSALQRLDAGAPLSVAPCPHLSFPDGTLVMDGTPAVYVMQAGARRWITGPPSFLACGYQWGNINVVPDGALTSVPEAVPLGAPPCP